MSTQVKTKRKAASSRVAQVDRYVGQQLKQTMRQVRISDTIAAFIAMLVFLIGYFIIVAFVDAWVWPLSTTGRIIGLVILAAGICFIAWKMFLPLVMRKINPQYAAKMIEEAKPTFKNSLLNYLSLRKKESKTRRAVLHEVTRKAATDLKSVSVDNMVDRSNIIRMGFTLVAIFSLAIVYSVLSPKNPLQTVARILAPTAKISKPAVVRIINVTPGDTDVFFGDQLQVTAEIRGRHEPEDVRMYFSTVDGQMKDVAVAMQPGTKKTEYVGKLTTGPAGIQSPLTYWIEARDGRTPDFDVNVRTNPAISINQITITPPEYTRLPERIIEGQGEVQCPEGSKISVRATANLPIRLAYLELLQAKSDDPDNEDFTSEDVEMKFEGNEAQGRFVATLNSKRTKQRYTHYRVRFVSENGFRNENPNTYPIRVIADLGPQVEIVRPTEKEVMLPVNQPLLVEVRAEDLDFEIKSVDLQFDHQGTELHDRNLHMNLQKERPVGGAGLATSGRVTAQSVFTPEDFNLNPGDKVIMHAAAADNRMSINGQPAPNISYTDNYLLVITEPVANPRQPKTNDEKKEEQEKQNQQDNQKQDSSDQGSSEADKQGDSESKQGDGNKGDGQSSENEAQEQQGDSSEGENGNSELSQSGDEGSQSQDSGNSESQQGSDSGESGDQSSDGQSGSESQDSDGGSDSKDSNEQQSGGSSDDSGSSQATGNSKSDANDASETGGGADSNSAQTDNDPNGNSRGDSQTEGGKNTEGSSSNRQQGDGGTNDDSQATGEGARDNSLTDGQHEPLAKDATEREKFERLKEWADQQGQKSDQDSQEQEQDGGPNESGDPNDGDGGKQSNQGNDADQTEPGQKQNSQKRDDQRGDGQSSEEPASDGNPNDGAKDGAQSQDGSPDGKPGDQSDSKTGQGDPSDSKSGDADSSDSQPQDSQQPTDGGGQKGGDQNKPGNADDQNPSGKDGEDGNKPGSKSGDNNQPDQKQPGDKPNDGQSGGGGEGGQQQPGGGAEGGAQESGKGGGGSKGGKGGQESQGGGKQSPDGQGGSSEGTGQGAGGGGSSSGGTSTDGAAPKGDDANLDYAKKATDMILNNLEDEKFDPSQELLNDMNMSADELREFVDRWQKMKQNARTNNTDRRKYENALRSLNLKPKTRGRTVRTKKDNLRGLSEDNALDQIPAGVDVNEFHEYLKSRNRASRQPRK